MRKQKIPITSTTERLQSTRESIISLLSRKWPLTTGQVHYQLKKSYGFEGSYQATHKMVKKLLEEKVLTKNNNELLLDKNWIENLYKFTQNIKKSYSEKNGAEQELQNTVYLVFNCFMDFTKFIINNYYSNPGLNPEKRPCVCFWEHVYPAMGIDKKEYENLKKMFENPQHYGISKNNTLTDTVFSTYLEKMGKKCVNGAAYSAKNDVFIHGDYILEAFFPPELTNHMNKIYSEVKDPKELELQKFYDFVTNKKYKINAIMYKNKELAEKLTQEAIKIYGKN